ncbi:unnamed protein product, partial [Brassica rapa subsp. narinosa]
YAVKVPEFLSGIGRGVAIGVETHIPKLEIAIGDLLKLQTCKFYHRKLILKYSHKYRLGLWRPRADAIKA